MENAKTAKIEIGYGLWLRFTKPRWWPLMAGPLHDDRKFFGFEALHRHIDPRYLTDAEYRAGESKGWHPHDVWSGPLHQWVDPATRETSDADPADAETALRKLIETTCIRTSRRKQRRPMPMHPCGPGGGGYPRPSGFKALAAHFNPRGTAADAPNGICPHRGADLTGLEPMPDGIVICPQHGLRCRIT